jgi:hypothetical protein
MSSFVTKQFIEKSQKVHGDKYDYSKVDYIDCRTKVEIICPIHGSFWQEPRSHIWGRNCPSCGMINRKTKTLLTKEQFLQKSEKVHNDFYNYSKSRYSNYKTKVEIICPIHGSFWQTPAHHIYYEQGCPECANIKRSLNISLSTKEFIKQAKKIHGNLYDYSKTNYKHTLQKVEIICRKHGSFWQVPNSHIFSFCGCPKCAITFSKPEEELRQFIQSLVPSAYKTKLGEIIPKQELDVFIPSIKIAFEFQGEYWHKHIDAEERDERKRQSCQKLGIQLYEIWENDWNNDKEKIKHSIKEIINSIK